MKEEGLIHLRANGKGGQTKDWICKIYQHHYELSWGRTGTKYQTREYPHDDPNSAASERITKKLEEGYWLVKKRWWEGKFITESAEEWRERVQAPTAPTTPLPNAIELWEQELPPVEWQL